MSMSTSTSTSEGFYFQRHGICTQPLHQPELNRLLLAGALQSAHLAGKRAGKGRLESRPRRANNGRSSG